MEALCRAGSLAATAAAPRAAAKVSTTAVQSAAVAPGPSLCLPSHPLRSQFLGSSRIHVPVAAHQNNKRAEGLAVRALFFRKLAKAFGSDPTEEEQTFAVYEVNDLDRGSPIQLPFVHTAAFPKGNLVPYTNKVCKPGLKDVIGESAGLCTGIFQGTPQGDRYETTYTHYLSEYGQICAMGPYYTQGDSTMVVTGGTGIFVGAKGIVKIHNVVSPIQLTYTYIIKGIPKLPEKLTAPLTFVPDGPPITFPAAATPAAATTSS